MKKFCTVINCMDGRVQEPVIKHLKKRFNVDYVDSVTEAGPNGIIANQADKSLIDSILQRVNISVNKHGSVGIAVAGHFDCTGNPGERKIQNEHTALAIEYFQGIYPNLTTIGLYINQDWMVSEI